MKLENLQNSRVKATFTVTPQEFEDALDKAFTVVVADVKIDGFRKGHCPRTVFEKKFGVESLFEEALNVVLNNKVAEVYADKDLSKKICGQFEPKIETKDFERGKEFEVSLSVDVLPEFELPTYKGLEIKKQVLEATEEEINASIEQDLKNHATLTVKEDQTIANGDTALFDFEGSVDGVLFDGGSAKDYELVIGSGQFIPGFEDQMIGMKKDEVKTVNVTFPTEYHEKSLAGKAAEFKVTLHEVKVQVLPELNDEFVANLGQKDITTVEALKASKKESIEANKKVSERNRQIDELFNQILDNTKVELPESLVAEQANAFKAQYEQQAKMYNIPFDTFLSLMGTDAAKFDADTKERGARQALFQVVMSKLVEVENIMPTKEEIEAKATEVAEQSKSTKDQVIKQRLNQIVSEITYNKVVDLLLSNAKEI